MDTKGEHILESELGRKLLAISPAAKAKQQLLIRLISRGKWDNKPQRTSGEGFTVWALGHANALKPIHCETLAEVSRPFDQARLVTVSPDPQTGGCVACSV